MKQFKGRPSGLGDLMSNPQKKSDLMSKTCISQLVNWLLKERYGKTKELENKYLTKGIEHEDESITLVGLLDNTIYKKNEEVFENDFLIGTPDIVTKKEVIDVKTSWDAHTFPWCDTPINKAYEWQLQGYMFLTGLKEARLIYCLINTPEKVVQDEIKKFCWKNEIIDCPIELEVEIRANHNFDEIPVEKRIKTFIVKRDEMMIKAIQERVLECRNYINEHLDI